MNSTDDLIARLSKGAPAVQPLRLPVWAAAVLGLLFIYGVGAQFYLGMRPDLGVLLTKPFYLLEVIMLAACAISGVCAVLCALYPDQHQRQWIIKMPFIILSLFVVLLGYVGWIDNPSMDMGFLLHEDGAGMQCTKCIAVLTIIPSALLFAILRKGASTHPLQAGLLAVITAAAIGCLVLRLHEPNDSTAHLILWHYLPTLFFAGIGAGLGKLLLKW